jgi:hypothetical protein
MREMHSIYADCAVKSNRTAQGAKFYFTTSTIFEQHRAQHSRPIMKQL